jgi:NADPH:quinone reductase-like Zn-dependent oxidoreductase
MSMRAVLIREHGAPESLRVEEVATPGYGDNEVLVDVHAAGSTSPTCW